MPRLKPLLGLDVGAHAVKMVEVGSGRDGQPVVLRFAETPTPPGSVVEGQVNNAGELARCVRASLRRERFSTRSAVVGLSGGATLLRLVAMPRMNRAELAEVLRWEAEKYLPIPRDEAQVDFAIVAQSPDLPTMTVMLVGANRRVVEGYVGVLRLAGLTPAAVETDAIAVARALRAGGEAVPEGAAEAGVDIGGATTTVTVVVKGVPQLSRTVGFGTRQLLAGDAGGAAGLAEAAPSLFAEVRRSLEFFTSQNRGLTFQRVSLFGGGAAAPGLAGAFAASLAEMTGGPAGGAPDVITWRSSLAVDKRAGSGEIGPQHVVAVGLALRGRRVL